MNRKWTIIAVAIAVAMAFSVSLAIAGDPPDQITIKKCGDKKSAVTFSHKGHTELTECFTCHHAAKTEADIKGCFECHGKDASAPDGKTAFHDQCRGCHKEQAKGPTKCNECHPK